LRMTEASGLEEPIRVDFLAQEVLECGGRLGMCCAPGRRSPGGDEPQEQKLESDLKRIKDEYGAEVLICLMEPTECERLGIADLFQRAKDVGLEVLRLPIPDGGTPAHAGLERAHRELVERVVTELKAGKSVVVHCQGGYGRSGLVGASVLVALGYSTEEAIRAVQEARPGTIESPSQADYVLRFEMEIKSGSP
jgi:protein-tyrosine phosphatase